MGRNLRIIIKIGVYEAAEKNMLRISEQYVQGIVDADDPKKDGILMPLINSVADLGIKYENNK